MADNGPRGYVPPVDNAEKRLQKEVEYAVKAVAHSGGAKYLGFYDERGRQLATAKLQALKITGYQYYGGFEGAERVMLCVFEDINELHFPLEAVYICPDFGDTLTHRDYLGAAMGAGLRREDIGDIAVGPKGAVVYVKTAVVPVLQQGLTQVGKRNVTLQLAAGDVPQAQSDAKECTANVASLRLDAVLASFLNTSRTKAAELVA